MYYSTKNVCYHANGEVVVDDVVRLRVALVRAPGLLNADGPPVHQHLNGTFDRLRYGIVPRMTTHWYHGSKA